MIVLALIQVASASTGWPGPCARTASARCWHEWLPRDGAGHIMLPVSRHCNTGCLARRKQIGFWTGAFMARLLANTSILMCKKNQRSYPAGLGEGGWANECCWAIQNVSTRWHKFTHCTFKVWHKICSKNMSTEKRDMQTFWSNKKKKVSFIPKDFL